MKPIILVGGGGHCRSVIEVIESTDRKIAGILDLPEKVGSDISGYPVVGTDADIAKYTGGHEFLVTVGHIKDPGLRVKLHNRIRKSGGALTTVTASSARVSRNARIGSGTVIMHFAMINAGACIGEGCIINTMANIEHDACVGDYTHISTGAMINGDCRIGSRTFIGSGCVVQHSATVQDDIVIGAASLVRGTLKNPGIYSGSPARLIKKINR